MQQAAKPLATRTHLQLFLLAMATASMASCSCSGRTALSSHPRDGEVDLPADVSRGDGSAGTGGAMAGGGGGTPTGGQSGATTGAGGAGGNAMGGATGGTAAGGSAGTMATGGVAGAGAAGAAGGAGAGGSLAGFGGLGLGGNSGGLASGGSATATGGVADAGAGGTGGRATEPGVDGAADDGPHWRESSGNLCAGSQKYASIVASVWSDDRGVFALVPDGDNPVSIWANSGAGWRTYASWPKGTQYSTGGIRGIVDGPLFAFGNFQCAIQLVDDGGVHCSGASASIADLFVVSPNLAYAAYHDILLKFDGELWTQLGDSLPFDGRFDAKALWADASTIVVVGSNGQVAMLEDEQTPAVLPAPSGANVLAAWAFGANDIWVGTEGSELYHYDGSQWSFKASLPPGRGVTSVRLWGLDGHLFVVSNQLFGEWDGSEVRNLLPADAPAISFTDVWGNSPSEVFASGNGFDTEPGGCSAFQVWWYDGTVARPM